MLFKDTTVIIDVYSEKIIDIYGLLKLYKRCLKKTEGIGFLCQPF